MPGVSNIFGGFGVEFDTTLVGGITAYDLGTGSQVANETSSGSVYPEFPTLNGQQPRGSFTTLQIATALGQCALTGTSIAGLTTGLKFYLRKHAEGSTRAAGSTHNKYTVDEGIVVPTSLTCDHQGDATLSYDVIMTSSDGVTAPVVLAVNQALPSGLTDTERFTIGPVSIESVTLDHVKQFTLNFGLDAQSEGADSEVWDRYASIREIKPSISLSGINPNWLAAAGVPLIGLKATHTNTAIYLRKRAEGSTFVADGSAQHIKFTAAGLATIDDAIQVSGQDPSGATLTMPLYYDGTNAPLIIDAASAIT